MQDGGAYRQRARVMYFIPKTMLTDQNVHVPDISYSEIKGALVDGTSLKEVFKQQYLHPNRHGCTATVATINAAENRAMGDMAPPQKFEFLRFENAARLSGMRFVIGPWTSMAYLHLHARVLRTRAARAPAQAP